MSATMHPRWIAPSTREPAKRGYGPHGRNDSAISPPEDDGGFGVAWTSLSRHQRNVARLRCQGMGNAGVAWALNVSVQTTKTHMTAILARLGSKNGDLMCYRLGRYDAGAKIVVSGETRVAA